MIDCYMKIDGIPGECCDARHIDWIEGYTFNHEFDTREGSACDLLHIQVWLDRSFPVLLAKARSGEYLPAVVIEGVFPISPHHLRVRYRLMQARIVAIQGGQFPIPSGPSIVSLVLSFHKCELTYRHYNPKTLEFIDETVIAWEANSPA